MDRQIDALVIRAPLPLLADDLAVTTLYIEPLVALVSTAHRFAGKESIDVSDARAEPLVGCTGMGEDWIGFWRLEPRDGGDPATLGPRPRRHLRRQARGHRRGHCHRGRSRRLPALHPASRPGRRARRLGRAGSSSTAVPGKPTRS
ncbi:LysR substrate-binding domain-containing protein [Amycolatopsis mediterranei]|uniref:LysR substrate-binding domain-containing protein n=1 Tax=Amycolatopsis mediterranei TaxID=33910 RepID=UPI003440F9C3